MQNFNVNTELHNEIFTQDQLKRVIGYYFNDILPNPDPILLKLQVYDEMRWYMELESDDMVNTCLDSLKDGLMAQEWQIYQGQSSQTTFDFVREWFTKFNTFELISKIEEAPRMGRSFHVINWSVQNGHILPELIETFPITLFAYNIENGLKMRSSSDMMSWTEDVPPYRVLNPVFNGDKMHPMGRSILSKVYWYVFFKKQALANSNIYLEKFGIPWVDASVDLISLNELFPNQKPTDQMSMLAAVFNNMVRDNVLIHTPNIKVNLVNGSSSSNSNLFRDMVEECNLAISRTLIGHTAGAMATPGKLGNDATAEVIRTDKINMRKRLVEETLNKLIMWICQLNTNDVDYPSFMYIKPIEDKKQQATIDALFAEKMGVQFAIEYLVREYHYEEGDILKMVAPQPVLTPSSNLPAPALAIADNIINDKYPDYKDFAEDTNKIAKEIGEKPKNLIRKIINYIGL